MRKEISYTPITILAILLVSMFTAVPANAFIRPDGTVDSNYELFGPHVDQIQFKMYGSTDAMWNAMNQGLIDLCDWPLTTTWRQTFASNPNVNVVSAGGEAGMFLIDFNQDPYPIIPNGLGRANPVYTNASGGYPLGIPPISCNVHFRWACLYLFDRTLFNQVLGPEGFPILTPVPSYMGGYIWSAPTPPTAPDYAAATAELNAGGIYHDAQGWYWDYDNSGTPQQNERDAAKIILTYRQDTYRTQAGVQLYTELENMDFTVDHRSLTGGQNYQQVMLDKNYTITTLGWIYIGPDPDYLYDLYHVTAFYDDPSSSCPNTACLNDTALNAAAEGIKYALTQPDAVAAAIAFQQRFYAICAQIPLHSSSRYTAHSRYYTGGNDGVKKLTDDGENQYRLKDQSDPTSRREWLGFCNVAGVGSNNWFSEVNAWPNCTVYGNNGNMTLRYGWSSQYYPMHINPFYSEWYWDNMVLGVLYDSMGYRDPYDVSQWKPDLVKNWTVGTWHDPISGTNKSKVQVTLRPDVYWSDGAPMTIADVVFSLVESTPLLIQYGNAPPWWWPTAELVKSLSIIDAYTVEILYDVASFSALGWTLGGFYIVPKHIWKPLIISGQPMNAFAPDPNFINSGPFRYLKFTPLSSLVVVAHTAGSTVTTDRSGAVPITSTFGYHNYCPVYVNVHTDDYRTNITLPDPLQSWMCANVTVTLLNKWTNNGAGGALNVNKYVYFDDVLQPGFPVVRALPTLTPDIEHLSWNVTAGLHTARVDAIVTGPDPVDSLGHANPWINQNITATLGLYVTPPGGLEAADLAVLSPDIVFSEPNPSEGQTITISAKVHNIGQRNLENVEVQFFDGNTSIGENQISFISHNSQGTTSVDWIAEHEGFHLIKVVADPNNATADMDIENNQATRSVLVGECPYFGGIVIAGSVAPNETLTGCTIRVEGYAEYNTTYGAGEPVAGAEVEISIAGWRQEATHTLSDGTYQSSITAPYAPGNYAVTVTVTDYTFWESLEFPLIVNQEPGVDLTLSYYDISFSPSDPAENDTVEITARIHNVGTDHAGNVLVAFYDGNEHIANSTANLIPAGGSKDLMTPWSATPWGPHTINVVIDPENAVPGELNENNNEAHKDIYVYPQLPDLTPTSIAFSDNTPLVNQTITISTNVQNIGGAEATTISVSFYDNETSIENTTISSIPGKNQTRTTAINYSFTTGGWHNVSVIVDIENYTGEQDESNNRYWRLVYVHLPLPDITISSLDIAFSNSTPTIRDEIMINATVHNAGERPAYDVAVCFYDGDSRFNYTTIPMIPTNGQETVGTSWNATPSGWHRIKVATDENNTVEEVDEGNNNASRYVYVSPEVAADVCVYSENIVFSNTNPAPDEHVTVYAAIFNIGEAEAQEVTVWFYVDDVQLRLPQTIASIMVGENANVTTMWVASEIGSHVVKVVADTQVESRKNNNNATAAIVVGEHDIAIISMTIGKTVVGEGYCVNCTLTFENNGAFPETFDANVSASSIVIAAFRKIALLNGTTTTLSWTWNTSGCAKGNYTLSAHAEFVPSETNISNNDFTGSWVFMSLVGDLTGGTADPWDFVPDGKVSGLDVAVVSRCFGSYPGCSPPMIWSANCDINNNGHVDGEDVAIAARHFGEADP